MELFLGVFVGVMVAGVVAMVLVEETRGWPRVILLAISTVAAGIPVVRSTTVTGERDFCYVERSTSQDIPRYVLVAHVPWRNNVIISSEPTLDAAASAAERIGCPLR